LPVDTFIVAQREGDDLTSLKGKVGDRPILAIIQSTAHKHASSTLVKKTLKEHKPIDQMVDAAVIKIIEEDRLYQ
jgi:nicotinic acid mononucleotide adenylyltransferase